MARFHPPQEVLVDYALGNLGEPQALLVATHLTFCPVCRHTVAMEEEVAGLLLEDAEAEDGEAAAIEAGLAAVLSRLDEPAEETYAPARPSDGFLPRTFAPYLHGSFKDLRWRTVVPGFREIVVLRSGQACAKLMRVNPGRSVAAHTHEGAELTLVLSGLLSDQGQVYTRGDVAAADGPLRHAPTAAGGEECICLVAMDGPLRFDGVLGPVLRWLSR